MNEMNKGFFGYNNITLRGTERCFRPIETCAIFQNRPIEYKTYKMMTCTHFICTDCENSWIQRKQTPICGWCGKNLKINWFRQSHSLTPQKNK